MNKRKRINIMGQYISNKTRLIHIPTGNTGVFVKECKPDGMNYTTRIQMVDGWLYYAPSYEFAELADCENMSRKGYFK